MIHNNLIYIFICNQFNLGLNQISGKIVLLTVNLFFTKSSVLSSSKKIFSFKSAARRYNVKKFA